jgi:hypothetical protein
MMEKLSEMIETLDHADDRTAMLMERIESLKRELADERKLSLSFYEDAMQLRLERARLRLWKKIATSPRDGKWIIALCNDLTSLMRIKWLTHLESGESGESGSLWVDGDGRTFGDGMFSGWIDWPE